MSQLILRAQGARFSAGGRLTADLTGQEEAPTLSQPLPGSGSACERGPIRRLFLQSNHSSCACGLRKKTSV